MEDENLEVYDEECTMEDIIEENDIVLNALIELLIEKKIISEEELQQKIDQMEKEMDDEGEDSED
jgi:hypothetical protein